MENNTNQISSNYCKKNCGFFGNQAFDGYCSKCYKEHVKRQNSGSAAGRVTPTSISLNNDSSSSSSSSQISASLATPVVVSTTTTASIETSNSFNLTITNDDILNSNNSDNNSCNTSNEINNAVSNVQTNNDNPEASSPSSSPNNDNNSNNNEKKAKRTRCNVDSCRRKLGLTGFDCRCGGVYCWEHRYSDKHSCEFDYKEMGQEQIRKNNPVVVGEKIQKI